MAACGTPGYWAPEVAFGDIRPELEALAKADAYSFGVVLVELLTGLPAYDMDQAEIRLCKRFEKEIAQPRLRARLPRSPWASWPDEIAEHVAAVASTLLNEKREERFSVPMARGSEEWQTVVWEANSLLARLPGHPPLQFASV
jgi:serine/threonine protein kinase